MATPLTLFRASTGLNMRVDPTRVQYDGETGVQDLTVAYNVDHDQTGRINRRKGYAVTSRTEAVHSLWCDGGPCLFVAGTSLCQLASDLTYSALATVTAGATVDYEQVGDKSYWVNGHEKGVVQNGANSAWVAGAYFGPDTKRQLSDPPVGSLVSSHSGYMYVAQGPVLFYSDPYSFNAFDLSRGFLPFEFNITMVHPVAGGIYVGTEGGVFWLGGQDPKRMSSERVSMSPAIRGTDAKVNLGEVSFMDHRRGMTGIGVIWMCKSGIFLGLPDGQTFNLTHRKLTERSALTGSGLVIGDRYIALLDP